MYIHILKKMLDFLCGPSQIVRFMCSSIVKLNYFCVIAMNSPLEV